MADALDRIVSSSYKLLRGEFKSEPALGGYCLQLVRIVVEDAFKWPGFRFYEVLGTQRVERSKGSDWDWWARDIERSLANSPHSVDLPRTGPIGDPARYVDIGKASGLLLPGDILFRWDTAKNVHGDWVGHAAILLPGELVLENVASRAGALQRGATKLSRLGAWPITSVARIEKVPVR